jgi:hypothetical protein
VLKKHGSGDKKALEDLIGGLSLRARLLCRHVAKIANAEPVSNTFCFDGSRSP